MALSTPISSNEITDESFNGTWCGKWDGIYEFCLIISSLDKHAEYKWKEHPNGKFKKASKNILRKNINTIKLENILLVLSEDNIDDAHVIGVFKVRSRLAKVEKQK